MQPKVTLEKFYSEFVKFAKNTTQFLAHNSKEHQAMNRQLKRIETKLDYSVNFLDNEIMSDRKRITKLEDTVYRQ